MSLLHFLLLPLLVSSYHCGPPDVASFLSEEIAKYLAKDMTPMVDAGYAVAMTIQPKRGASITHRAIEIGCNLTAPYEDRVEQMARNIAAVRELTKITKHMIFLARHNIHRSEHWFKDLQLLGIEPVDMLKKLFSIPWTREQKWTAASLEGKEGMIEKIILKAICQ